MCIRSRHHLPPGSNRTSLLQLAARAVAERPRVAFILIVALALIGLGAVLYLLFRSRRRPFWGRGKSAKGPPGSCHRHRGAARFKAGGRNHRRVSGACRTVSPVAGETVPQPCLYRGGGACPDSSVRRTQRRIRPLPSRYPYGSTRSPAPTSPGTSYSGRASNTRTSSGSSPPTSSPSPT